MPLRSKSVWKRYSLLVTHEKKYFVPIFKTEQTQPSTLFSIEKWNVVCSNAKKREKMCEWSGILMARMKFSSLSLRTRYVLRTQRYCWLHFHVLSVLEVNAFFLFDIVSDDARYANTLAKWVRFRGEFSFAISFPNQINIYLFVAPI